MRQFGEEFAVSRKHSDVPVVDEQHHTTAFVRPTGTWKVSERPGVSERHLAVPVDLVATGCNGTRRHCAEACRTVPAFTRPS